MKMVSSGTTVPMAVPPVVMGTTLRKRVRKVAIWRRVTTESGSNDRAVLPRVMPSSTNWLMALRTSLDRSPMSANPLIARRRQTDPGRNSRPDEEQGHLLAGYP